MELTRRLVGCFLLSAFALSCVSVKTWDGGQPPPAIGKLDASQRQELYDKFELIDWSHWQEPAFYLRPLKSPSADLQAYSLSSLKPVMLEVGPYLADDITALEDYHSYKEWLTNSAAGLLVVSAIGAALQEDAVYYNARNAGLLTLFLGLVMEQFEWQIQDQLHFQYNNALRQRLRVDDTTQQAPDKAPPPAVEPPPEPEVEAESRFAPLPSWQFMVLDYRF
jgi:hypothetical protein